MINDTQSCVKRLQVKVSVLMVMNVPTTTTSRDPKQRYTDTLEERVKYLEETVASLTLLLFNLQGQVLDMDEKSNEQSEHVEVVNTPEKCKTFPSEENETTNKSKVTPEKESVRKPKDSSETLNLLG